MGQWGSTPCFIPSINLKFSFSASPLAYIFRYRGSNAPAPLSSAQALIGVGVRDAWKLERVKDSSFYPEGRRFSFLGLFSGFSCLFFFFSFPFLFLFFSFPFLFLFFCFRRKGKYKKSEEKHKKSKYLKLHHAHPKFLKY